MRRKQFRQLISALRAELRRSSDPAVGVSDLPTLKQTIARCYETAFDSYDWPHLSKIFDKIPLQAGERYYDFPEDTDYDRIDRAVCWFGSTPIEMSRGIDFEEYAERDSTQGERSDPALKWDVRSTDTVEQCEIWPIPASNNYSVQFKGHIKFAPLVDEEDLCLIDDQLVVLMAAAELLPAGKAGDSQIKLTAAQARAAGLKARSKQSTTTVRVGLGGKSRQVLSRSIVRVSGS